MKRERRRRSLRNKTWVPPALGALTLCAPPVLLVGTSTPVHSAEQQALLQGIPAQPLARALETFANQSGLQLVYVSALVRNQMSHVVPAGLSVRDSLARLLTGTNLNFTFLTVSSVRIVPAAVDALAITAPRFPVDASLEEVIVTANHRAENAQSVPMTVQVMTGATLEKLNATTFDDFLNYLPGVTAHGFGPSQNEITVRGLDTNIGGVQSAGAIGTFPNVTVYLDEQAAQLPTRNLDIYAADLERIEVLEGPQGTLFGAGAEAGVLRYITNKPKLNVTETRTSAGYATTENGGASTSFTATVNIPVSPGRFAVRAVIYTDRRGGYIDNKHATFARAATDPGMVLFFGGSVPANSVVLDNSAIAGDDTNPVLYRGLRAQALYRFNEDWNVLLSQSGQNVEADGVFTEMAADSAGQPQPDLTMPQFNPSYDHDRFRSTALTINGRVGPLKILYAGSYLTRNVEQVQDYTQYSRNTYSGYYQCFKPGPTSDGAQCFSPSATWQDLERNTHLTHELRVSTSPDARIRGVGGVFFENYRIKEQTDWSYLTALPYFYAIAPPTGYYTLNGSPFLPNGNIVRFNSSNDVVFVPSPVTSNNPNVRPPGDAFFDDITRGYTQRAAYASIDLALVPSKLVMTLGTRYSRTSTAEAGSTVGSFGCGPVYGPYAPNPCVNHSNAYNLDALHLDKTYSGFTSRANLTWNVGADAMLYYTWSQGFRAGGFNRAPTGPSPDSPLADLPGSNQEQARIHGGYVVPTDFAPDSLTNHEVGWKTRWLDQRIQWNGALFLERWNDTQMSLYGLGVVNSTSIINGGDYMVRGLETSVMARIAHGLAIEASAAWNHSELAKQATFRWRDGTPIDFSGLRDAAGNPVSDPNGQVGTPLAGAPPFQGNVRVRYEYAVNGFGAFVQVAAMHQAHSFSSTSRLAHDIQGNSTVYDLPAYTTYDASLGLSKGPWLVQFYGENLADTRAQLYAYYAATYKAVTPNRPRTIGFRFAYTLNGA